MLLILLVGPFAAYIGFGAMWLAQRGWWLYYATGLWILSGIVFAILAARWTASKNQLLPPIDWDSPQTFAPRDRAAWALVQEEADRGESISMDDLSTADVYIDTGRRLVRRLAAHYHPLSHDPIEHVPLIELLTALQLAAEDLTHLCHQVPGGDLLTTSHWRRAVQAAEYLNWANDVYTYLLPIIQPVTGIGRLVTQKLMVKPAWKNMQQNLLRWFYQAYVNRLGTHLIELYSGRLAIGVDQYRRLTRRGFAEAPPVEAEALPLVIAVAGARDVGKSRLIELLKHVWSNSPDAARPQLAAAGLDETVMKRLRTAQWVEVPGYTATPGGESARDRATRRDAVTEAVKADLLLLVVDGTREDPAADVKFAQEWDHWYLDHPGLEVPPAVAIVTGVDRPEWGGNWKPPHDWAHGSGVRETAVRTRLEALRSSLPPTVTQLIAVGLGPEAPFGVSELILPALAAQLHRAERVALIRYLHRTASRSKAKRLMMQVGQHGRRLWDSLRNSRSHGQHAG
ncbi:MAG TPA: GTPase [Isosphaeraceae bacterium]|nr:GTPase [Isosphaeraceae bacterium]